MSTKRLRVYTGSMRNPLYRYVVDAHLLFYENKNPSATHFVRKYVEMCRKFERRRVLEEYRWSIDVKVWPENDIDNSYVHYKFLDGTDLKYELIKPDWDAFLVVLQNIRNSIESDRAILGFDDEMPDDEHILM